MADETVLCEKVTLDAGTPNEIWQLVQYTEAEKPDREACLRYLGDCGHTITTEPHPVVGPGDDPAVSWGDLSDIIEPRDD